MLFKMAADQAGKRASFGELSVTQMHACWGVCFMLRYAQGTDILRYSIPYPIFVLPPKIKRKQSKETRKTEEKEYTILLINWQSPCHPHLQFNIVLYSLFPHEKCKS